MRKCDQVFYRQKRVVHQAWVLLGNKKSYCALGLGPFCFFFFFLSLYYLNLFHYFIYYSFNYFLLYFLIVFYFILLNETREIFSRDFILFILFLLFLAYICYLFIYFYLAKWDLWVFVLYFINIFYFILVVCFIFHFILLNETRRRKLGGVISVHLRRKRHCQRYDLKPVCEGLHHRISLYMISWANRLFMNTKNLLCMLLRIIHKYVC